MTVADMLKSAQYVVDDAGHRQAVIVTIEDWDRLLSWIEAASDMQLAQAALAELELSEGDAVRAGWIDWQSVRSDWHASDDADG